MGSARSVLFTTSSALMIFSGAGSIACAAVMAVQRLSSAASSVSSIILHAAIVLIFSILNILCGINGLRYHNRRINSAVIIRLPAFSIVLCMISIILSLCLGTFFIYVLILAGTGILIPAIFICATVKKSNM